MVAATLAAHDYAEATLAAALLHDVVEDSDTTVEELRAEFGDEIADLVAALSDDESIEDYRDAQGGAPRPGRRGRRRRLRDLRRRQADQPDDDPRVDPARRQAKVADEFEVPLGAEARGLGSRRGDAPPRGAATCPCSTRSSTAISLLRGGSRSGRPSSRYLSRRLSGSATQSTKNIASTATVVTTVVATVPQRTLVTSMIAQVIASARTPSPAIASRLATNTSRCFCW